MGEAWIQTSTGRVRLPISGVDLDNLDEPIPVALLIKGNRCLDGTIQVASLIHGTITFNFTPVGRTGSCISCGQCCSHPISSCQNPGNCGYIVNSDYPTFHVCQFLTIKPGKNKLGKAGGTECSIYATLFDTYKGCTTYPADPEEITSDMPACGFSFG